jgi:hypothetical protein
VLNEVPRHEDVCYLIKHHSLKTYWVVEVNLHAFLTSILDGGEWSASRPVALHPGEELVIPIGKEAGGAPEMAK